MTVSLGAVDEAQDRIVAEIESMNGVTVVEDYGRHEEDAEVVPDDHPDAGGLWVREVRVGLDAISWEGFQGALEEVVAESELVTSIGKDSGHFGGGEVVRICCTVEG